MITKLLMFAGDVLFRVHLVGPVLRFGRLRFEFFRLQSQNQNCQDYLLVTCQDDNHSPKFLSIFIFHLYLLFPSSLLLKQVETRFSVGNFSKR